MRVQGCAVHFGDLFSLFSIPLLNEDRMHLVAKTRVEGEVKKRGNEVGRDSEWKKCK